MKISKETHFVNPLDYFLELHITQTKIIFHIKILLSSRDVYVKQVTLFTSKY